MLYFTYFTVIINIYLNIYVYYTFAYIHNIVLYSVHTIYQVYMAALPPNSKESSSSQRLFDSCLEEVKRLQEQIEV